jgi:hypothetical protein
MALRAIWQFMDRDVTHKILFGRKRNWSPYTILWVTDRSMNCHLARSAMNYLLYYTQYMQICQTTFFVIVYLRRKTSSEKTRKKTLYWSGAVNILKYWPAALTKTHRENKNVKYNWPVNILVYWPGPINIMFSSGFCLRYAITKTCRLTDLHVLSII